MQDACAQQAENTLHHQTGQEIPEQWRRGTVRWMHPHWNVHDSSSAASKAGNHG